MKNHIESPVLHPFYILYKVVVIITFSVFFKGLGVGFIGYIIVSIFAEHTVALVAASMITFIALSIFLPSGRGSGGDGDDFYGSGGDPGGM